MKATPEDVAKRGRSCRWRWCAGPYASMKATPEDVAKVNYLGDQFGVPIEASMKATPEDVAKVRSAASLYATTDRCLNEGHARRRGEVCRCHGEDQLGRCPGLNEGHARRRGEATSPRMPLRMPTSAGLNEGHARRRGEVPAHQAGNRRRPRGLNEGHARRRGEVEG